MFLTLINKPTKIADKLARPICNIFYFGQTTLLIVNIGYFFLLVNQSTINLLQTTTFFDLAQIILLNSQATPLCNRYNDTYQTNDKLSI